MPLKIMRPTLAKADTVEELRLNLQLVLNEIYTVLGRLQPAQQSDISLTSASSGERNRNMAFMGS